MNLNKVDTDGNTINDKEATFIVNGDEKVTKKGFLSIDEGKGFDITSKNQNDKYVKNESLAPEGYFKFEGKITLDVKVKEQDGAYKLDSNNQIIIDELIEAEAPMPSGQENDWHKMGPKRTDPDGPT